MVLTVIGVIVFIFMLIAFGGLGYELWRDLYGRDD